MDLNWQYFRSKKHNKISGCKIQALVGNTVPEKMYIKLQNLSPLQSMCWTKDSRWRGKSNFVSQNGRRPYLPGINCTVLENQNQV